MSPNPAVGTALKALLHKLARDWSNGADARIDCPQRNASIDGDIDAHLDLNRWCSFRLSDRRVRTKKPARQERAHQGNRRSLF